VLPRFIERFSEGFPRVVVHVQDVPAACHGDPGLRDRKFDLVFLRQPPPSRTPQTSGDVDFEYLFDDPLIIAAGLHGRWARRRTLDLEELIDEPWILPSPGTWNYDRMAEACRAQGIDMPIARLTGFSMHLSTTSLPMARLLRRIRSQRHSSVP